MHIRTCEISKSFGERTLFENLSFSFHSDEHIGLIGPNGSGKSTLLKILCALEESDSGSIEGTRNLRLGYLPQQEENYSDLTFEQALLEAMADLSWSPVEKSTKARILMSKAGVNNPEQSCAILSGGWRKRLAILRVLVREPDIMLLDEPTNHLDLAGILWIEQVLQNVNAGFIVISHDRYILESVTDRIIEINPRYPGGFLSFPGTYSDFLERREEWFTTQNQREDTLSTLVKQEIEWLRRGPQGRRTKSKSRIQTAHQKIGDLADLRRLNQQRNLNNIDFSASGRKSNDLVVTTGLRHAFGEKKLFSGLDLTLTPGSRLGIVGNNGTGKTTLVRCLLGDLEPAGGKVKRASQLKYAWFDQRRELLDRSVTLRRALAPNGDVLEIGPRKVHVVSWAQDFLFHSSQLETPVGSLSGGEQARVLLANIMRQPVDILFFDEPTNDLDIDSIEVLEARLCDFPGAVVLITHDRALLDRVCTEIVGLHNNGESGQYGELAQWLNVEERQAKLISSSTPKNTTTSGSNRNAARKEISALTREEQKEFSQMEGKIAKAEAILEALQVLPVPESSAGNHQELNEYFQNIAQAQEKVDLLFARWAKLEEKQNLS